MINKTLIFQKAIRNNTQVEGHRNVKMHDLTENLVKKGR